MFEKLTVDSNRNSKTWSSRSDGSLNNTPKIAKRENGILPTFRAENTKFTGKYYRKLNKIQEGIKTLLSKAQQFDKGKIEHDKEDKLINNKDNNTNFNNANSDHNNDYNNHNTDETKINCVVIIDIHMSKHNLSKPLQKKKELIQKPSKLLRCL